MSRTLECISFSSAQQPNFVHQWQNFSGKLIQNVFTLIPKLRPAAIIASQTELVVIVINWPSLQNSANTNQDEFHFEEYKYKLEYKIAFEEYKYRY